MSVREAGGVVNCAPVGAVVVDGAVLIGVAPALGYRYHRDPRDGRRRRRRNFRQKDGRVHKPWWFRVITYSFSG